MIQINELNFNYPKQDLLFSNLNLELENGSITGLLGKNGAGKSTLLKLMAGLLTPKKGDIQISDQTPHDRLPAFLRNKVTLFSRYKAMARQLYFDWEKLQMF